MKIICIGRNYVNHIEELKNAISHLEVKFICGDFISVKPLLQRSNIILEEHIAAEPDHDLILALSENQDALKVKHARLEGLLEQ